MLDFLVMTAGAAAIFLLPGYAILALARRQLALDWVESLCLALGLSLAAIPLFLYATTLLGLRQGPRVVAGLLIACALVVAWDQWGWVWWAARNGQARLSTGASPKHPISGWAYAALGIVLLFTLVSRFWSVWGVEYPFWTDSYGHGVIAQMVVDQGTVPTTYAPYAPIDDFTYHFGFHAMAAWLHWITGAAVLYSMVVVGQVFNVLVVPTTYIFAQRLLKSQVAGLVAAVVAALLSHMPAQFVNWGRFTQLDGQMLLPVAIVLYYALLQTPKPRYRLLLLVAIAFAGLFLTHYRIFIFGTFLAAILWAWAMWRPAPGQTRLRLLLETALLTLLGLLILAPWLWRLANGFGGNYASMAVSGYDQTLYGNYYNFAAKELLDYGMQGYLWVLAGVGALWGLWRRKGMVVVILLWILSMFAGANLHFINITPLYSNTIVILAIYLPLAMLIGYLVQEIVLAITKRLVIPRGAQVRVAWGLLLVITLLGILSIPSNLNLVARDNIFVRDADVKAMQWIREETAPDSLFYIAISFWTPGIAHGLDGGYFLPLLAARQTIMPPQHYASDGTLDYRNMINDRLYALADAQGDAQALWGVLNAYGITHVYIGARDTYLDPEFFSARPDLYTLLYDQDGVWVFAVNSPAL